MDGEDGQHFGWMKNIQAAKGLQVQCARSFSWVTLPQRMISKKESLEESKTFSLMFSERKGGKLAASGTWPGTA